MKKTILAIIIPLAVILFSTMGLLITKNTTNRLKKEYNSTYEYYLEKEIYGTELTSLINKTVNENEKNKVEKDENNYFKDNGENSIRIEVKILNSEKEYITYPMEEMYNKDITRFVQYFNLIKFKCTKIEYHKNSGTVSKLLFEEVE